MAISNLSRKLLIKPGQRIAIVNAPKQYLKMLRPLPAEVEIVTELEPELEFIHLFVRNVDELERLGGKAVQALHYDAIFWISYPKKSSKMKSDITRDVGWHVIEGAGLEGVAQVAIDETWSASRFRPKELVGKSRKA